VSAVTPSFPWELEAPLGRGGQGSTFRARHVETGQIAAVKRFRVSELADWKRFDLFEREVATLAQLDHPAIPHYLGHGTSEDGTERWLAMELVPGDSLATRLQAGLTLSPEAIADLFHQALDILAYLHSRVPPIIHRDVKPHNLIVRPDGRLALVDFGSVKTSLRLDGGSTVVGTFGYLAPEQLHGEAGPATDLYALGVTMVALATGIDPSVTSHAATRLLVEGQHLPRKGLKIDLDRALPTFPIPALREAWSQMIEPDPERRPQDVATVRALASAGSQGPSSSTTSSPHPASSAPASATPLSAEPPPWLWTPRGPLGRLLLFVVALSLRLAMVGVDIFRKTLLPFAQSRQRERITRRDKKDPVGQSVALAQLAHYHDYQRARADRARGEVDRWRRLIDAQRQKSRNIERRGPPPPALRGPNPQHRGRRR
jgi:serine/threonine protein kinase